MTTYKELSSLLGRNALITGASGGLGKVFADTLGELGANLILVDLPGTSLEDLALKMKEKWKVKVNYHEIDLEIEKHRKNLIDNIIEEFNKLNILVNNAGFVGSSKLPGWNTTFEKQSIESWRRAFEVNLTAVFALSQGFVPIMKDSIGASIVNISSIYGLLGPDWRLYADTDMGNPAAYSASKGALIQFTRWLSTTLAPLVRVNAICPGGIFRNQPESFVSQYEFRTPMVRMAKEEDFKGAIGFLASDLSAYVTGQSLNVDGGWSAW